MLTNVKVVKTTLRVNGREYASPDDLPADVRRAYERALDESGNDRIAGGNGKIVVNGQEYHDVSEMPAAVRELYQDVMATVDANDDGIPDALQTGLPKPHLSVSLGNGDAALRASFGVNGAVRAESTTLRLVLAVAAVAALVLVSFALGR